ncbi:3-deoxy-8-phosphooctulonate synthase [bacterium]|nr:3-deoxy-8-phosphooctulonate synthase [FCB group bacterium]MBL7191538.1 3-deoxy-8-phosphooctulonate synthase [bacterium]
MKDYSLSNLSKIIFTDKSCPFLIAGPCALEDEDTCFSAASAIKRLSLELEIPVIFKGSFCKANRTREKSFHGVGMEIGLRLLDTVKHDYNLPVTSDVHTVEQLELAAEYLDIIQIPALLCKNTDLLHAAGGSGCIINIKKGAFITAEDMRYSIEKVKSRGNPKVLVTERGTQFGYIDTIVDFRSIAILKSFGCPIVFDASHSVRNSARRSEDPGGGSPEAIPVLTRCAAAAGVDGLFIETHPEPEYTLCDSITSYPLNELPALVKTFVKIYNFMKTINEESSQLSAVDRRGIYTPASNVRG